MRGIRFLSKESCGAVDQPLFSLGTCNCEQDLYLASLNEIDCGPLNIMYWYHPDYPSAPLRVRLDSVEFVTDLHGLPYQFFLNTAWGESLETEYRVNFKDFSSRFRFNAKERDKETGNYYYGARYYDPQISVWLSVDPWASKYPHVTPYNFVDNNSINLIDPTGMGPEGPSGDGLFGLKPILGSEGPSQNLDPLPPVDGLSSNAPQGGSTPTEMWEEYGKSFNQTFKKDITEFVGNNPVGDTKEYNEKLEDFIINYDYNQVESEYGSQPVELAKYRTGVGDDWAPSTSLDPNLLGTYSSYPPGYVNNPGIPNPSAETFRAFGGGVLQVPNS